MSYPLDRIEVEVFDLPVVEIACKADSVVCHMWLFTNDNDIIFASSSIELQKFLT